MSGITRIPRSSRTRSPAGVVGPFAPSTTMRVSISFAVSSVITPPRAAGIRTSTSRARSSSLLTLSPLPSYSVTDAPFSFRSTRASTSRPSPWKIPPPESLTPTTRIPSRTRRRAAQIPTFPKPWTATAAPSGSSPASSSARTATWATPAPVADRRPSEPPSSTGFPVTTPGSYPANLAYSSTIHAMTSGPVLTSGAGMSSRGPMNICIRSVKRRVRRCRSPGVRSRGSQSTPPLAPPKGRSMTAVFQVMREARARTSSRSTSG